MVNARPGDPASRRGLDNRQALATVVDWLGAETLGLDVPVPG